MAYASQPADVVYGITKSMIVHYDVYKDSTPGIDGFELKRQDLTWALPYHDGAVKAIKESGAWTGIGRGSPASHCQAPAGFASNLE
jgi:TRAP-type uncharacterized transport system substrate-binding protein